MELSWSTFLLEIINFLVLVWILKRFLYKPVMDVIERRRKRIEAQLGEARDLRGQADGLRADYENRLADWEQERRQLQDKLSGELDEERSRQMAALQSTLEEEREKSRVAESRRVADAALEAEQVALRQGARFASRLLSGAAGPELEDRLLEFLLEGLSSLGEDQANGLRTQWGEPPADIRVASAFPVPKERRRQLEQALREVTGMAVPVVYEQDPELVAGLRISIGAWVLRANVRDELKGFTEFAHVAR